MLKKILFGLLGLILLLLVISFFLPSKLDVERSVIINAPEENVFFQVNDLQKMVKWSPWLAKDPQTLIEFGPKRAGTGALYKWKSDHAELGSGVYKIIKSEPFRELQSEADFYERGKAREYFTFSKVNNGVKVSWTVNMEMGSNPISRYRGLIMEGAIGSELEKGLAALRTECDKIVGSRNTAIEQFNPSPGGDYSPRMVNFPARKYMAARKVVTMRDMEGHMQRFFPEIYDACLERRIEIAGAHSGLFYSWDDQNGTVDVAAAMPVRNPVDYSADIKILTIPAGKAVMVEHKGPYDKISNAHLAAQQYMQSNGLNLIAPVIEEYITDGNVEPDPEKWLTRIYFLYQ